MHQLSRTSRLTYLLVVLSWMPLQAAYAQEARSKKPSETAAPQQGAGWAVHCGDASGKLKCIAQQAVVFEKTGKLLVRLIVNGKQNSEEASMQVHVPLGLDIPAGVKVSVGKSEAQRLDIRTCNLQGCFARMPIPASVLKGLKSADSVKVVFQGINQKIFTVDVPLKGFAAAYDKL